VDAQAGAESMMNLLTSAMTGTNYILHACGILESYMVSSFEKFVIDEENCGIVKHIRRGIPVNEDTLAFDTLKEVGPKGGAYLTLPHTLSHYKSLYEPRLFDRSTYLKWKSSGSEDIAQVANRLWKKRVEDYVMPDMPEKLNKKLKEYVEKNPVKRNLLS